MRNRKDIEAGAKPNIYHGIPVAGDYEPAILETLLDIRDLLAHPPVEIDGTIIDSKNPYDKIIPCNCPPKE